MMGPNEPHELTPWFNAGSHPPTRVGEYNFRGVEKPNWPWVVKECRATWDGKAWKYTNQYGTLAHSISVNQTYHAHFEWQGLVGPERNMEVDRHESDTDEWW